MGLSMSKQEKLEHREMKFYKKYYPGVHVECRGPIVSFIGVSFGQGVGQCFN